eukprot:COSAG05_NODE_3122_length_2308_cov_1.486646_2_plen_138_part_00
MESHQAELDRSVKAQIETQERAQAQQKLEAELVERQRAGEEAAAMPFVAIGFDTASVICNVKQAAQVPSSPLPRTRSFSAPVPRFLVLLSVSSLSTQHKIRPGHHRTSRCDGAAFPNACAVPSVVCGGVGSCNVRNL